MKFNKSRVIILTVLCSLQFFCVFGGINFANRNLYFSLAQPNSRMQITNSANIQGWKKQQIMKTSAPNTNFLQNNQIWQTAGDQFAPEETFEFADDLKIPDGQLVAFPANTVIDGKGHDLILGKYAQLLVDGGVTVTFKNMTIKNTLNTISCPPIRCMDWYSQACFDNVTFAFNNDWAFRNGEFFIHNDVDFTGTAKFSYRSVRPSYITSDANFIFSPNTTFEYYPSTTNNNLIKMADKTSAIIFDGSTLQTTATGIRLTKGSLYFDNKVTLSSMDNTLLVTTGAGINVDSAYQTISVAWSPDGRYLVLGNGGQISRFYSFNGSSFTFLGNVNNSSPSTVSVAWSPDGKYLVLGNDGQASTFYSFNGSSFTLVGNVDNNSYSTFSIAWSPDGKYLVLGNDAQSSTFYSFNGSSFTLLGNVDSSHITTSVAWSPDGKYLVLGNNGESSTLYRFNGSSFTLLGNVDSTHSTFSAAWSPDGKYLILGNLSQSSTLYRFNGSSFTLLGKVDSVYLTNSAAWSPDGKYLVLGNSTQSSRGYSVTYTFDTSPQGFSNGIIFGNSAVGSTEDLNVYAQAAARVGVYGKVWQDCVNNVWNFQSRDSYVSLDRYDSQFRITNASTVQNWKKDQIIKSSAPNTFFLQDNQVWATNMNQFAPEETFELMNDLIIPDGQLTQFPVNGVIDGQGHDLILGKYAQLLVDGGVTVTFKNMTIKNTLNTISCPPIRCMDWYSQACFDNVTFAFNNDWAFRNGEFFIHNDVDFTGTAKFSYRSVRPSYITSDANFIFSPNTTFEYYPSTTDNNLIKMADKTSSIYFDGSTLQTTSTGIRLTKGSVYFDNKVTLSSMDNTLLANLGAGINVDNAIYSTNSIAWSPDGRYFVLGNFGQASTFYSFNGSSFTLLGNVDNTAYNTLSVVWSPDGKYLVLGNNGQASTFYRFDGSFFTLLGNVDSAKNTTSVAWSPDGRYLVLGNNGQSSTLYSFNGSSFTLLSNVDSALITQAVAWSPDGKYLVLGNSGVSSTFYRFNSSSFTLLGNVDLALSTQAIAWSPDGKYLVLGNSGVSSTFYRFNGSSFTLLGNVGSSLGTSSVAWSPDGKYLVLGAAGVISTFYKFNGSSFTLLGNIGSALIISSVAWSPDGKYLVLGNGFQQSKWYPVNYTFDTSPQGFSNGIVFGNSAVGSSTDLNVYAQAAARVGIYGKVWQDSVNNAWNFQSRDSYVSLDRYDSQFRITNASTVQNWKKDQIIKSSAPNTMFLQNNQVWATNINQLAPEETFEFMDNLIIPDGTIVTFSANAVIDGRNFDLLLGNRAQLFIDTGITVTLKNLTLKNTLNTNSTPPIKCIGQTSKLCLDNVKFALNNDFVFGTGQAFIHNDVKFTGTAKFSYRSVRPSYITTDANLKFGPQTTFEYFPGSANNSLINMADSTSAIWFDGSTLQTTQTGIRLTKGSLYFDNKVTLSSTSSTSAATPPQTFSNGIIFGYSLTGTAQDLSVYTQAAARVGIYGKVWQNSVNNAWNFQSRDSYVSLDRYDSQFRITNASTVQNWKKDQIIKSSAPNTMFLQNNQVWTTNINQLAPEETFEFMDNLIIPDGQLVDFPVNGVIDGQGHDLVLGKYAQLLIDGGVTVTFKNMTIKNTLNTISCPPIRCMDWYSQACFDNVTFAFNNDWAFRNGEFFIHNDVEFTGTAKFSYRSVRPSYITSDANFIFSPNTTFEYYPSTTNNNLIKMADKTSSIIFDGSTLQTTSTGIRLTKGSLYFDNKVTLSSMDNTLLVTTGAGINVSSSGTYSVAWSPDGRYLVLGRNGFPDTFYSFNGSSFTLQGNVDNTSYSTYSVAWSPDGRYLVLGNNGQVSTFYSFNGSSFTFLGNVDSAKNTTSVAWSLDGKYLVLGNSGQASTFYSFNGSSFTFLGNVDSAKNTNSAAWSPDEKYLVLGNFGQASTFYSFNGSSFTLLGNVASALNTSSVAWSPDGRYLVLGNNVQSSTLYRFNGSSFTLLGNVDTAQNTNSAIWSPDGKYLVLKNSSQPSTLYRFNGFSFTLLGNVDSNNIYSAFTAYSAAWSPDGKYLFLGHSGLTSRGYPLIYTFDTSPQGFSDGIIFGNSMTGSSGDLSVYAQAAARVGVYGKVWQDSVSNVWNFQSRDSYVSLDRYDSQFRITNASTVQNWKKDQIIKSSAPNTFFLQDNQVWATNMNQFAPEETYELMNDLIIPDGQLTQFPVNGVIDGQGHDLILGKYAQLLVDGGVTVTFKNMTIKNTLNTISCPPIRCMDWYSKACFDNVTFAFNNDWAFRNGEFFIHNDVEFTGTAKFSYRSVRPSYITSDANFIFSPNTTFEYYPSTTNNNLIKMADKTSSIYFDGSTLQTTATGIRLTKGSLYFDNKVTLSSMDNTLLTTLSYPPISQSYGNEIYSVSWSPDGRFLAIGGTGPTSGNELQVYQFNGSSLILVASKDYGAGVSFIYSVSWSPDGKYLAIGGQSPTSGDELQVYLFTGSSLNLVTSQDYGTRIRTVNWSPDGRYLAIGGNGPISGNELQVYQFNVSSLSLVASIDYGGEVYSAAWSPDGRYLAIGGSAPISGNELQVYQFNGSSLSLVASIDYGSLVDSVSWSPDRKYLAIGGNGPISGNELQVYQFNVSSLSLVASIDYGSIVYSATWSPDGRYLAIGGQGPTSGNELQVYQFSGSSLNLVSTQAYVNYIYSASWSPDEKYLAIGGGFATLGAQIYSILYTFDTSPQGFSNGIIFGNSAFGVAYDTDLYVLGGANVIASGRLWYDDVN